MQTIKYVFLIPSSLPGRFFIFLYNDIIHDRKQFISSYRNLANVSVIQLHCQMSCSNIGTHIRPFHGIPQMAQNRRWCDEGTATSSEGRKKSFLFFKKSTFPLLTLIALIEIDVIMPIAYTSSFRFSLFEANEKNC